MVSSVLEIEPEELVEKLRLLRDEFGSDPGYLELRRQLPEDWPI